MLQSKTHIIPQIPYFNNFALDPHRIQPFTHPPQTAGSSQPPPPQAYGLPANAYPTDFPRPPPYPAYGAYPPYPGAPPPPPGGFWDPYAYPYGAGGPGAYPMPPPRRDDGAAGRRLSDRISGVASGFDQATDMLPVPAPSAGLPAKPMAALEAGAAGLGLGPGPGARRGRSGTGGVAPAPPLNVKEDPRASAGKKVSYVDVDQVAEGDVELTY